MRISGIDDLKYYYERDEVAYWRSETCYFDPGTDTYYDSAGRIYKPQHHFNQKWFDRAEFKFKNGDPCYLHEQDPSRSNTKHRQPRNRGDMVNFIKLGAMSLCSKVSILETRVVPDWKEQLPCSFAVKSLEYNRCMFCNPNLYGHCSSPDAYAEKTGKAANLDRVDTLRRIGEVKPPSDHHFKDAENIPIDELNNWYNHSRLKCLKQDNASIRSVFYDARWDVFFNGKGKFLKEMTTQRREKDIIPEDLVNTWLGDFKMEKQHDRVPIFKDNSGVIDPIEMHELLHEIAKFKFDKDPNPTFWNILSDDKEPEGIFGDHVINQLFTDKPNAIDHICDEYPYRCPSCTIYICPHKGKHI